MKFLKKDKIALGNGEVYAFTFIEVKRIVSILTYSWGSVDDQMRFHSHAFNAIAITLWGSYVEDVMCPDSGMITRRRVKKWMQPRFVRRNHIHRIIASNGCRTLVICGPWNKNWYEFFATSKLWVKFTWGRKQVAKQCNMPMKGDFG